MDATNTDDVDGSEDVAGPEVASFSGALVTDDGITQLPDSLQSAAGKTIRLSWTSTDAPDGVELTASGDGARLALRGTHLSTMPITGDAALRRFRGPMKFWFRICLLFGLAILMSFFLEDPYDVAARFFSGLGFMGAGTRAFDRWGYVKSIDNLQRTSLFRWSLSDEDLRRFIATSHKWSGPPEVLLNTIVVVLGDNCKVFSPPITVRLGRSVSSGLLILTICYTSTATKVASSRELAVPVPDSMLDQLRETWPSLKAEISWC